MLSRFHDHPLLKSIKHRRETVADFFWVLSHWVLRQAHGDAKLKKAGPHWGYRLPKIPLQNRKGTSASHQPVRNQTPPPRRQQDKSRELRGQVSQLLGPPCHQQGTQRSLTLFERAWTVAFPNKRAVDEILVQADTNSLRHSSIQYSSTHTPTTRQPPTLPSIAATSGIVAGGSPGAGAPRRLSR